jgi:hypothetical protein
MPLKGRSRTMNKQKVNAADAVAPDDSLSFQEDLLVQFVRGIRASGQADVMDAAQASLGALLNGAIALRRARQNPTLCLSDVCELGRQIGMEIVRGASTGSARQRKKRPGPVALAGGRANKQAAS